MPLSPVTLYGKAEDNPASYYIYRLQGQPVGRGYTLYVSYFARGKSPKRSAD